MVWVIIAILAIIIGLIEDLIPVIIVATIVFLIYAIVKGISNSIKEKEAARIASVTSKVNSIISHYAPTELLSTKQARPYDSEGSLLNKEVIDSVRRYKKQLGELITKCHQTDGQIVKILDCQGCASPDEKLVYLQQQEELLTRLKNQSDAYNKEVSSRKLQLLHEDRDKIFSIKKASLALLSSKKCVAKDTDVRSFFTDKSPVDLHIFKYDCEPVTLFLDGYFFCIFSNVILVFDCNGIFSSALDPTALKIEVVRQRTKYSYDKNIDTDSKAITYSEKRTRWLYACKDGSPDLRYNGNRQIEYQVEVNGYEYGTITIKVGKNTVSFSVSSSIGMDFFEDIPSTYCHACNFKHNPIPNLLNMMELVSEERFTVEYISKIYLAAAINNNYFCKEVVV